MAVYLDTNIIPDRGGLPTLELATAGAMAKEHGLVVKLPELVVEEATARHVRALESVQGKLTAAIGEASSFWPVSSVYLPDVRDFEVDRREQIAALGIVMPLVGEVATEALRREIWRRRPAREGRGGRDAAIWTCVAQDHESLDEPGYFVSRNTKDFGSLSNASLHPDLLADMPTRAATFRYCASPEVLFGLLGQVSKLNLHLDLLTGSEVVAQQVAAYVADHGLFSSIAEQAGLTGSAYLAGPVQATPTRVKTARAYEVAGKPIVLAWTDWQITCHVGVLQRFALGGYGHTRHTAQGQWELQVLARLGPSGAPEGLEITNSGATRLDLVQ